MTSVSVVVKQCCHHVGLVTIVIPVTEAFKAM